MPTGKGGKDASGRRTTPAKKTAAKKSLYNSKGELKERPKKKTLRPEGPGMTPGYRRRTK